MCEEDKTIRQRDFECLSWVDSTVEDSFNILHFQKRSNTKEQVMWDPPTFWKWALLGFFLMGVLGIWALIYFTKFISGFQMSIYDTIYCSCWPQELLSVHKSIFGFNSIIEISMITFTFVVALIGKILVGENN